VIIVDSLLAAVTKSAELLRRVVLLAGSEREATVETTASKPLA
jgi:hypothetical protein